jgi:hypothetical protein
MDNRELLGKTSGDTDPNDLLALIAAKIARGKGRNRSYREIEERRIGIPATQRGGRCKGA